MLDFDDFLKIARKEQADFAQNDDLAYIALNYLRDKEGENGPLNLEDSYDLDKVSWPGFIVLTEVGGVSGGSCWDSSNPQPYYTGQEIRGLDQLDSFLEKICPQITYLQFKKISKLILDVDHRVAEYYGNHTKYRGSYLDFNQLYQELKEMNLI